MAEHISDMQKRSQNGQTENTKFGEEYKMKKEMGAGVVNKWKRRGEGIVLRVSFSWQSWRPINNGWRRWCERTYWTV